MKTPCCNPARSGFGCVAYLHRLKTCALITELPYPAAFHNHSKKERNKALY
jgi:hypothetical protein